MFSITGMNHFVLDHELPIRLFFFLAVFAGMALWELAGPRRPLTTSKSSRWLSNLGMVVIDSIALRLLLPATAVTVASYAASHKWGLFNTTDLSGPVVLILGLAALDAAIYFQHVMFHAVPLFWRLHRVHHTDLDIDVTTGVASIPANERNSLLRSADIGQRAIC
jgi:sterol desaturase/sphingolipid hydroxylase (fatty acid hydroxylase superfamily)